MAYTQEQLDKLNIKSVDTVAGITHYLVADGGNNKPVCLRPIKGVEGQYCANYAGFKTDHVGQGGCKFHPTRNVDFGRHEPHSNSVAAIDMRQRRLALKSLGLPDYRMADYDALFCYRIVAEEIFRRFVSGLPDELVDQPDAYTAEQMLDMILKIAVLADRSYKTLSTKATNAATVQIVMARARILARRYIKPASKFEEFMADWQAMFSDAPHIEVLALTEAELEELRMLEVDNDDS